MRIRYVLMWISRFVESKGEPQKHLAGLSVSRDAIEMRISEQSRLLAHYSGQLKRLEKEAEYDIEKIEVFYENEEDDLFDRIVECKKEIKVLEAELKKEEKARWALETEKNLLVNDLTDSGGGLYEFDCDLQYIPTRLKIFEGTVRDNRQKIERKTKEYSAKIYHYNDMLTQLRIKDGTYHFAGVECEELSGKAKEDMHKDLSSYLNLLFKELAESDGALRQSQQEVMDSKQKVLDYCRDHVDDYRLKEAVINGLMVKTDYAELLVYQERMTDIIMKTIQLANDDKRESDTELMTFLSHLMTYVKTVIHELGVLQKKTMIELESGSKQILCSTYRSMMMIRRKNP